MQFTSLYFILFFLPAALAGYHLAGKRNVRLARLFLLACSFFFCGTTDLWSLLTLLAEIAVGVLFSRAILRAGAGTKRAKRRLIAGILLQLGALGFFKYTGFLVGSVGFLLQRDMVWRNLILPLGISYTTFTQIAYLTDCFRGVIKESADVGTYALYLSFFPKLAQGPITTGTTLLKEFADERAGRVTAEGLADGIVLFALGLSKKLLLADVFGQAVDVGFAYNPYLTMSDVVIMMFSYTFQIYFDFSGYSDMAIGVARMFGYTLPVNFNSPYRARSITDFWRRWHMSLTGFLREYLYFPLGGSRRGALRTCVNIMVVFLVSGLWHGANWTFVLWGFFHGLLQVTERLCARVLKRLPGAFRQAATFFLASFLWLLFRCSSVAEFKGLVMLALDQIYPYIRPEILTVFRLPGARSLLALLGLQISEKTMGVVSMFLWMALALGICLQPRNNESGRFRRSGGLLIVAAGLLVICILFVNSVSSFIYTSF